MELRGQLFLSLPFSFLHLEFIEVVHPSASSHVDVIGNNSRLLEELDIQDLLVAHDDWLFQSEMDDGYQLVLGAWLEEGVLHV